MGTNRTQTRKKAMCPYITQGDLLAFVNSISYRSKL